MANSPQAKKRIRRNEHRAEVNRSRVSRVRTNIKQVEAAIEAGDKGAAMEALKKAQPEIMRGAQKGIAHKKAASRKVSRLNKRVKALAS